MSRPEETSISVGVEMADVKQSQEAGEASNQFQAGRDLTITVGLSYADVKSIIAEEREAIIQIIWTRAQEILREAEIQPAPLPMKTTVPLLQSASLEEDPYLQERWANLLANAAAPDAPFAILPSFSDILRQLTARHAILMDSLYEWACAICRVGKPKEYVPDVASVDGIGLGGSQEIWSRYASLGFAALPPSNIERLTENELQAVIADEGEVLLLIDDLVRLRLLGIRIHAEPYINSSADKTSDSDAVLTHQYYHVSALGFRFVNACRNPISGQRPIIQT